MSTAVEELIEELKEAREDLEDGYTGHTDISTVRARKKLMNVKRLAHQARKELLSIRKGEREPVDELHISFTQENQDSSE